MLIFISCLLLFGTALALIILRITRPNARYSWLVAIGGAGLALFSVFLWRVQLPATLTLLAWQPVALFVNPLNFRADALSWPYAVSLTAVTLTILVTAVTRPIFSNSYTWAGTLALGGLGMLAITANNPLTLLLVWGALDITELLIQLRGVDGPENNEKVVISFATRSLGSGILLWANILSIASGSAFDFDSIAPAAGLFLIAAAGLRLGVLPLHLPYAAASTVRRGIGTSLRLVSAASSLILLARIPAESLISPFTPILIALALLAALYGGWMWLRAPDELNGRPHWIIGLAALSVTCALSGNPLGAVAWGCAMLLGGGALFLASEHQTWLDRTLLVGAFSLSALPFTLTASAWSKPPGVFTPFALISQALLMAGYIRHTLRTGGRVSLSALPNWTRAVYAAGLVFLIGMQILLGVTGWDGAQQIGTWPFALFAAVLTFGLIWAAPRFRVFNPIRTQWLNPISSRLGNIYDIFWGIYRVLARSGEVINSTLEGDGGIMWTLLFLALFITFMTQGRP